MQQKMSYEDHDKSTQHLKFEDDHFPAYFRLLKWKFLDICINSMEKGGFGYFTLFKSLFPGKKLAEAVEKMTEEMPSFTTDPDFKKLRASKADEKAQRQAETYLKMRHEHKYKVQRRRYAEYFLKNVLFNEEGLRIADRLMYENCPQVYGTSHWEDLPTNWVTHETFKEKFYEEKELKHDRFGMQKLDRIAGSARGMIIMKRLGNNPHCTKEFKTLEEEVNDNENMIHTDLVKEMLDEGPVFEIVKDKNGEEQRQRAVKWSIHKTLILFFTIPGFDARERKPEDRDEWYYGLLDAMRHDAANRSALHFLNSKYSEDLEERDKERDRLRLQVLKGQQVNEEAVGEQIFETLRPQPKDNGFIPSLEAGELVLRTYQEELVQTALEGKNCVIIAPTGSGKTEVAIYAAMKHISGREAFGKPSRVVLVVPKIPLVTQQKERFLKYCTGKYVVNGFHGSEKSDSGEGRRDDVLASHIVVMTPQILINMLQSVRRNERLYVSDFSMMIFDEVHYTTGAHAYVTLNRIVQEWEYEKPQIIGLTASLNVNASQQTDINSMLNGIYSMLALLNTPHLSTITHQSSIDELNKYVSKPDDTVEVVQPGENVLRSHIDNYLSTKHYKLVAELEKLSKSRHNCFPAGSFRTFKNTKPKDSIMTYESLVQSLIQDLNKLNTPDKMVAQKWTKYIRVYIEARGIVDVMPAMVAFNFMEESIRALNSEHTLDQFSDFLTDKVYDPLKQRCEGVEPEIVKKLKTTLVNQFKEQPDSRVIIFVTQRNTAQRVSEFLNESGILEQFLNTTTRQKTVGYVLGTNNTGSVQQSPQEQQRVLEQFNSGKLKVIVATSVVEEGLDVTSCNLIIKYNCSSASAIQLVQRRGRARAKNSRSVLLAVHSKIHNDESNAMLSEKFMRQCVKIIEQNGNKMLEKEVEQAKDRIERQRAAEAAEMKQLMERNGRNIFSVNCAQCHWFFCKSTDIKKVSSNIMAFHPTVWDNVSVESQKKAASFHDQDTQPLSILKCHKCQHLVGKAYKMRGVYLPQFAVKNVNFAKQNSDETATKAAWSGVQEELFFIGEATQHDFEIMLNALGNTEANMDKKRILDLDSKQLMKTMESKRFLAMKEKKEQEARKKRADDEENGVVPTNGSTDFSEDEN